MGIDGDDTAIDHGDPKIYAKIVEFLYGNCVTNNNTKMLLIGGDDAGNDGVTGFWKQIENETGLVLERAPNEAAIKGSDFQDIAVIAVASGDIPGNQTPDGGLTLDEHQELVKRQGDIAAFINAGGGLIGMSSEFAPSSFGYMAGVGGISVQENLSYTDITPTPRGAGLLTDELDLCCWHNTFEVFPSFLEVLATKADTGEPAAIGGCQVTVPSPCADVVGDEPLCATDGSGDFTYTFTVTNNTEEDIHHLFLLEPTPPVTITPNYFDASTLTGVPGKPLCSPDDPTCDVKKGANTSKPLTVTIANAAPEDVVSFLVSIHDAAVEECCSVKHTVELPACDCGQVSLENPFCSISAFPFVISQKYQFTFQNLLPDGVDNLLIAPSSGSNVTVTPNQFLGLGLAGVPYIPPAGEHTATVTLTGPDAKEGKEVCLRISSHDEEFQECCSVERCFPVGSCTIFVDDFNPVGDVTATLLDTGFLRLQGFGLSGNDGARFDLGGADRFSIQWLPLDETAIPDGAFLRVSTEEPEDEGGEELLSLRVEDLGEELEVRADSREGSPLSLELTRAGLTVGEVDLLAGASVRVPSGSWPTGTTLRADGGIIIIVIWPEATPVEVSDAAGSRLFVADELTFGFPEPGAPATFATARLLAAGIPEITVTEARGTLTDCNGNGVSDAVDIAGGASADEDGDGVPDECQVRAPELEVHLDTGFDETKGRPVRRRAPDDDWRVVVDGSRIPARRVGRVNRGWNEALPGTAWISLDGRRGASVPGLDVLRFERCFCIGDGAQGASLDLDLFADDSATVFLNGGLLGGPGGRFNAPEPLSIRFDGIVGQSLFQRGENCLVVEVEDSGGVVTGLDLAGTVLAEEGACPAP